MKKLKRSKVHKTVKQAKKTVHHRASVWHKPIDPFVAWGVIALFTLVNLLLLKPEFLGI